MACHCLVVLYKLGMGVEENDAQAAYWYSAAVDKIGEEDLRKYMEFAKNKGRSPVERRFTSSIRLFRSRIQ